MDVLAVIIKNAEFIALVRMKPCDTPIFRRREPPSYLHYYVHELGGRGNLLGAVLHCVPPFDHIVCVLLGDSEGFEHFKLLNQTHHLPDRQIDDALDSIQRGLVLTEHFYKFLEILGIGSYLSHELAQFQVAKELFWHMCTELTQLHVDEYHLDGCTLDLL